ncbi:MAG: sulfide/dihydroorotate dehydrogenase-like FAD/NAD-binding protein [Actinobacteria bacterium]|nr:sulfide/dihydroorotate dehydrogenase-like FAD/NAD-binding protein [Actinomycetota bacterium]
MQAENRIIDKSILGSDTVSFTVYCPVIAKKAKAGQFVVIRARNEGERIPLTIADRDPAKGIINITILKIGKTSRLLSSFEPGDIIPDIAGPLGKPSEIENFGTVVIIGGGVGIAPTLPIIKTMKEAGNYVISVIGARNCNGLIFKEAIKTHSDEFYTCTDDGSEGFKGFVSDFLIEYIKQHPDKKIDRVVAIGPVLMMKAVCDVTRPYGLKTIVSLNPIMVDGTGMCGSCRVEVGGKTMFGCVDGPEFDGHLVDFKLLSSRLDIYREEEKTAYNKYMENHKCKMSQ